MRQVFGERTGDARGHFTLWGEPDELLSYVRDVIELDQHKREHAVKPSFELWDSESANYMGNLCVDRGALADIGKAFPTTASKSQILNLVLTVELDGDDDERWFSSTGRRYVRLVRPDFPSELKAS